MSNQILIIFLLFLLETPSLEWTSLCDKQGRCTIIDPETNEEIYLLPGYLPFYPSEEVIPQATTETESNSSKNFTLTILTGYPKKGIIKENKNRYECVNGLNECVNSCCEKGFCNGNVEIFRERRDKAVDLLLKQKEKSSRKK